MRDDAIRIGIARVPRTLIVGCRLHAATYLLVDSVKQTITDNESQRLLDATGTGAFRAM